MSDPTAAFPSATPLTPWWRRPSLLIVAFADTLNGDDFGYVSRFSHLPFSA